MLDWLRKWLGPVKAPGTQPALGIGAPTEAPAAADAAAVQGFRARPMLINPSGHAAAEGDWYRLDAITRHCEQLVAAGLDAAHRARWEAEHFPEATERFVALNRTLRQMQDTDPNKFRFRTALRDLNDRLRKVGWDPGAHMGSDA